MCLSFRQLQSHLLSHWFPTIKWTFTKQLLKDTWQAKCFQWSSRWTGWRERPPYQRTAPSSGQKGDNKEKKISKTGNKMHWFVLFFTACLCFAHHSRYRPWPKYSTFSSYWFKNWNDREQESWGQRSLVGKITSLIFYYIFMVLVIKSKHTVIL